MLATQWAISVSDLSVMNVRRRLLRGRTVNVTVAHQPLLVRAWKRPESEKNYRESAEHSYAAFAKQRGKAFGGQAGRQKHGPGADTKCQHQQGAIQCIALARGPQ